MSKIINQPVLVVTDGKKTPRRFFWIKKWVFVERIMDVWSEVGQWWDGEPERTVYRILADSGKMFELQFQMMNNIWMLYKVYD